MARVVAVCRSKDKGTRKDIIKEGVLEEGMGLAGDAHACSEGHRQISLLAIESIERMRQLGYGVGPGDFAENITTEAVDLLALPVGSRLGVGRQVVLEISQHGKTCHAGCAIFKETGKCIMPREGVFARVITGGPVKAGDAVTPL